MNNVNNELGFQGRNRGGESEVLTVPFHVGRALAIEAPIPWSLNKSRIDGKLQAKLVYLLS